jgi:hypothetical protein
MSSAVRSDARKVCYNSCVYIMYSRVYFETLNWAVVTRWLVTLLSHRPTHDTN